MAALEYLPPGVRTDTFRPDPAARRLVRATVRAWRLAACLLSVSRLVGPKGQDNLIRAVPQIANELPQAMVHDRRRRPGRAAAARHGRMRLGLRQQVRVRRAVCPGRSCRRTTPPATSSPCRAAPAAPGLTSRVSGSSSWRRRRVVLPVIAGRSGGAPETVQPGRTGTVVDGRDVEASRRRGHRPAGRPDTSRLSGEQTDALGCGERGIGTDRPSDSPSCCPDDASG